MAYGQSLPYNPTTILLSSDVAYIFSQDAAHQLRAINISSTLSSSNSSLKIITQDLPFITDGSAAYIPSISAAGQISVYAGDCAISESADLWALTPESSPATWSKQTTNTPASITSADLPGANFLAGAFSFSDYVHANASQTKVYIFGGMCPEPGTGISAWQSNATYSNHMLRLAPEPEPATYAIDFSRSRGPPIAEAGFTITGLTPTFSNTTGIAMQQQNFVLLGGHTQTAFINMSQVAIWSLPEESWSFVTVASPPTSNPNTELAVKSLVTGVDSRSGHTSLLTEDGTKIIVYGGWVGNTEQAAEPQLIILELGTGFGGDGNWQWLVPIKQPSGNGIYGHGATMLPGNVMMVMGGYNISSSEMIKRDSEAEASPMFFNATSLSWVAEYINPTYVAVQASNAAESQSKTKEKSDKKKLGLGIGLGLGLAAILIVLVLLCCYNIRVKLRREDEREKHIQSLSAGSAIMYTPREMGQRSGGFPWSNNRWNRADDDDIIHGPAMAEYEDIDTSLHGLGGNVPLPPRQISRKPVRTRNAKGAYQPAPNGAPFDYHTHGRTNSLGTAGPIHPIYEADEDDNGPVEMTYEHDLDDTPTSAHTKRISDPFRDQPNLSSTTHLGDDSESPARSREREIQEWVSDWAAADAMIYSQARSHSSAGRVSPNRRAQLIAASYVSSVSGEEDSGRTASNLSEQSVAVSAMSNSHSDSSSQGRSRNDSLRGFITNAMSPFSMLSTTVATTVSIAPDVKGNPPKSSGSSEGASFNTAHTSFSALQAEAEGLLTRTDDGWSSREASPIRSPRHHQIVPGSPSKNKPAPFGRSGWLGSIRKAFTGDSNAPKYRSPSASFGNRTPSPIRVGIPNGQLPRRAVSAGAMLWRRKQGKSDWEDSADLDAGRSSTFTGELRRSEESDDWDIEQAVRNRVVQVMFTVPKEKLRVVNHDFTDDEKSEVGSLRSKKGSGRSMQAVEPLERVVEAEAGEKVESTIEIAKREVVEGKGKGKEIMVESPPMRGKGNDVTAASTPGKGRSKVKELVEDFEWRASPERSPDRSSLR